MPSNRTQVSTLIKNRPLATRKLSLFLVPCHRLRTKGMARPERIFVVRWLTAMHVEIFEVPEWLGVVVNLVAIEFACVIDRTSDIGCVIDLCVVVRFATEDDSGDCESSFGKLSHVVIRTVDFASLQDAMSD